MKNSVPQIAGKTGREKDRHGVAAKTPANGRPREGVRRFFTSRWRGQSDLGTVFWRDMLLVGTIINGATTLASIAALAAGAPAALAAAVFFAASPYNVFLLFAVWRSAENSETAVRTAARLAALLWLAAASLL